MIERPRNDHLFVDVSTLPYDQFGLFQTIYILATYSFIIMYGSKMVSHGSELLLLVPEFSGIVGSVVLPIVGQLPDGAIVLFSGLGNTRTAQEQLNIGVGSLAGSCILMLTIPWLISIFAGRVLIINGKPAHLSIVCSTPKLGTTIKSPESSISFGVALKHTGVSLGPYVKSGAIIMMSTASTFLFLQIPGLLYYNRRMSKVATAEKYYALLGFFCAMIMFGSYLIYQFEVARKKDNIQNDRKSCTIRRAITSGEISVLAAMVIEYQSASTNRTKRSKAMTLSEKSKLIANEDQMHTLHNILRPYFIKFDLENEGSLGLVELAALLSDMGETATKDTISMFSKFEYDRNGRIDYEEFIRGMAVFCESYDSHEHMWLPRKSSSITSAEEEEDNGELPEDLRHLTPGQQQTRLKLRAAWMMIAGTGLILVFTDPTVEVLSNLGQRLGIKSFYVAFVLAPVISSGAEIIAAYNYSIKKTRKNVNIALSMLVGAVCMNNTLILGIFMLLVYMKHLAWEFLAETLTILLVQIIMGIYAMKPVHTLLDGCVIACLYPLSIALIAFLEAYGWD